ncbi:nucleotide sugar dehydrogenase [Beggiatoa alba B18LD]|uniref:UDP-glucose 6-dehydrogenase n=1 Tax=Beggiatoa alba B18LD TaxID=395493 RepID=I3CD68_9GAMM|nr:UDP-glucose/GDP-mannose dehydrogenase family protein [Beggiatoa alba]EIJ41561.1 nucleotide sugar dehydrogenase [Beggiatoa alba B18LD]
MRISIFGSGYVGLVTGACLAEVGNHVICVDVDTNKVALLNQGHVPIHEPGLDTLISNNMAEGRLKFTTDAINAIDFGEIIFIAVGTPPDEDGSADLRYVLAVAKSIGQNLTDYKVIIDKSTVPVGTADKVRAMVQAELDKRGVQQRFDVISNPEFLKEGAAIGDFMRPDRIIIGTDNPDVEELMQELYAPFNRNHDRLLIMDIRSAELTKYAANAMLATKISFMNEMANLAEKVGADIEQVRLGIGSDPRIGFGFIYAGCGYGGSCFPKDVKALEKTFREFGMQAQILTAVSNVNAQQQQVMFRKIHSHFKGDLRGKRFALWGLAFKPNTDDMREAPSRPLMEALWQAGASVQAYDPKAMTETQRIYGDRPDLTFCDNPEAALQDADALLVVTEWQVFRSPDFKLIESKLKQPVIFDGRNLYNHNRLKKAGFKYYAIGRGEQS